MKKTKTFSLLLIIVVLLGTLSACNLKGEKTPKITNIAQEASVVLINGEENKTVEAALGAFQGKQGDCIEFRFDEEKTFNTVFITEKTASVRQFNIYVEVDGQFKLIYTGKHILQENIKFDSVKGTAFKLEIVNTEIGNDNFIIQGVSVYNLTEEK